MIRKWLRHLAWVVYRAAGRIIRPGRLTAKGPTKEEQNMLLYEIDLPPVSASDVVRRILKVSSVIDGGEPVVTLFVGENAARMIPIRLEQDAVATLTLVDTDDAGNDSPPSEPLTFTASDTLAPPAPGALTVRLVGEE